MYGWLFDVRDFGAKGDAITDDSPAFQAAMDAMGPVTSGKARHGTLFVPPGVYRFKDDLKIERALKLVGTGPGSAWSKSRLLFDPYKGIRVYSAENSPRGGDANYAVIEDIDINCEGPSAPSHPVWQPKHKYNVGDKILPAVDRTTRPGSSWEYFYECVKSGTSGQEEPDWSVTQFIDQATLWQPETAYYYSSVVRPPERFDVYFTPNPPDHDGTYPSQPDLLKGAIKSGTTLPGEFLKAEPGDVVQEVNLSGEQITWHCYSTGSTPPLWRSGRRYAVGKVVRASTRGDALFRLSGPEDNTFRTSAPPEPGIFSTAAPGTTFTELGPDGSLTWECYLDPTIWQQYTDVNRGVRVRPTHRYDVAFSLRKISDLSGTKNFDSAKTGKAEPAAFATARPGQAVKEVGTNPTGNTTPGAETRILEWLCHSAGNYLVGDGRTLARDDPDPGPIWACRVAAAIYAQARVTINRVYVQSALNAGLHVQADGFYLPSSNANGFAAYDLKILGCGCGIVTRGSDCNGSIIVHTEITLTDKSDKQVGIAERAFLGNRYYSCLVQGDKCQGPGYWVTSAVNSGGLYGCYAEGTGPIHIASTYFHAFGGTYGPGFTKESRGWVISERFSINPFYIANDQSGKRVTTYVGYDDNSNTALGWRSEDDGQPWLLRWYDGEKVWSTEWANSAGFRANYFTGNQYPRGAGIQGFDKLLLGFANAPIKVTAASDPPPPNYNSIAAAAGQPKWALYQKGDIVFNTNPFGPTLNHQYIGWVCVEVKDDNNQVWKAFGKIES